MYFETGADCLRGMMSPGNIVSGHVVSGADCLQGMLSPGAGCLRGRLSPERIVSGADCLGAYCLRGTLSPGRIVLGHIVSGHIVSGGLSRGTMSLHPLELSSFLVHFSVNEKKLTLKITSLYHFRNILVTILPHNKKMDIFKICRERAVEKCLR